MTELNLQFYTHGTSRWVQCHELLIFTNGKTFKKAMADFGEELDVLIAHYGMCPESKLSREAIKLKEFLLTFYEDDPNEDAQDEQKGQVE